MRNWPRMEHACGFLTGTQALPFNAVPLGQTQSPSALRTWPRMRHWLGGCCLSGTQALAARSTCVSLGQAQPSGVGTAPRIVHFGGATRQTPFTSSPRRHTQLPSWSRYWPGRSVHCGSCGCSL
ncbi:MAG: hypothetical protein E5X09_12395 [Mesorhizobium sp.]|nr:MAG: hypothetical protein E5X09_12395 [Mesorhizobium sp.]